MSELFLIAQVAGRGVAFEGRQIDSVVDIGAVVPVPRAPAAVRGLAALRSRVVTVVDTRVVLGLDPTATPGRAVIARIAEHPYAFLVDSLEDVAAYRRLPHVAGVVPAQGWGTATSGLIGRDGEPLPVIDLATLVPSSPSPLRLDDAA